MLTSRSIPVTFSPPLPTGAPPPLVPTPLGVMPQASLASLADSLPLFTPASGAAHAPSLQLLADAAAAADWRTMPVSSTLPPSTPATGLDAPQLHAPGPFNPRAALSIKVVKKILDLEFIEMAEVSADDDVPQVAGRGASRLPISDLSQWLERFSLMAAVLVTRFPEKAPELFAFQATIVRAERNYEGNRWVTYDRQFRREALAQRDLNWSVTDSRLYNEAFTGRARAIARCSFCLQDDHAAPHCPRNPDRMWPNPWLQPFPFPAPMVTAGQLYGAPPPTPSHHQEVCRRFNEGRCRQARCRYTHVCKECHMHHAAQ